MPSLNRGRGERGYCPQAQLTWWVIVVCSRAICAVFSLRIGKFHPASAPFSAAGCIAALVSNTAWPCLLLRPCYLVNSRCQSGQIAAISEPCLLARVSRGLHKAPLTFRWKWSPRSQEPQVSGFAFPLQKHLSFGKTRRSSYDSPVTLPRWPLSALRCWRRGKREEGLVPPQDSGLTGLSSRVAAPIPGPTAGRRFNLPFSQSSARLRPVAQCGLRLDGG